MANIFSSSEHHKYNHSVSFAPENTNVGALADYVLPVNSTTRIMEVYQLFVTQPEVFSIPVIKDGIPLGLVNRSKIVELFSRPYTRELYGQKPIDLIKNDAPIIVDANESIDDLARIIIDAGTKYMYDGYIITENGRYAGMGTVHDVLNEITGRKQAHLYHLAHYDQLTGLPNRFLFKDRLEHACKQADRGDRLMALLFLDLDRFKMVNDTYGHAAGDKLLKVVSDKLKQCVRDIDTIARLGGDEFTIILEDIGYAESAQLVAQKILKLFSAPITIDNNELFLSASIGIVFYSFEEEDCESLIKKADVAMYHAKEHGRGRYQMYTHDMSVELCERVSIESKLRQALSNNELSLHYQPQVNLTTGEIVGVEALIRWHHPEMGYVSPDIFIPIAEESGLIRQIGEFVLREACMQNKSWQAAGLKPIVMAVNLSACQLRKEMLVMVEKVLKETGLNAEFLELEITENVLLENIDESIDVLQSLNQLGVKASIDDFGTGYSSLSYLQRLPIDALKIDRSFLMNISSEDDDDNMVIIKTIIAMAKNMQLKVIAEGVETEFQVDMLRSQACDQAQGYLFSKPCINKEIEMILKNDLASVAVAQ